MARSCEFDPNSRSTAVPVCLSSPVARSAALVDVVGGSLFRLRPHGAHVQQRGEEIVVQTYRRICEHAVFGAAYVHVQCTHTPTNTVISGAVSVRSWGTINQQLCRGDRIAGLGKVAEAICHRLEIGNGIDFGLLKRSIAAARCEGHSHVVACVLCSFLDPGRTGQHDQVSDRDFLVA